MQQVRHLVELPRSITVETTSSCQLRCPSCPTPHRHDRPRGFFTTGLLKELLNQVSWPLTSISFGWSGEPLLNRDLPAMISMAKAHALTYVSTNGLLLERDCDLLIDSGLDHLRVCLDGINQVMAEKYRVGVDFDQVIRGLKKLVRCKIERRETHPLISFQMLVTKDTESSLNDFINLAVDCGVDDVYFKSFNLSLSDWLTEEQQEQLAVRYLPIEPRFLRYERNLSGKWVLRSEIREALCPEITSSVTVLHTGEVVPCCEDFGGTHILGNIRMETLADIWTGDAYAAMRARVRAREPRMCRDCSYPGSQGFNQLVPLSSVTTVGGNA